MTTKRWLFATMLSTMLSLPALVSALSAQEIERLRGPEVAVYNLAGRMEIVAGEGTDVVVRVSRGGEDAGALRIETGEIRGRQTLRVVYPGDEIVYPELDRRASTEVRVGDDGTFSDGSEGGDRVTIRGSGDGIEAWADLVIELPAGQRAAAYLGAGAVDARGVRSHLDIRTGTGAVTATDMAGALAIDTGSGRVRVSAMNGDLSVDTGSGSIHVENLGASEKVELDTGSGDIEIENLRVGGKVEVDTGSGSVSARALQARRLLVDTGSGSVDLESVAVPEIEVDTGSGSVSARALQARRLLVDTGSGSVDLESVAVPEIEVDTGSGSVEVDLLTDVDALEIDTGSGSVTVSIPSELGATVEIDSGSGGVDVEDLSVEVLSVQRDHVRGRIGDGEGRIAIDTGAGRVRLVGN